MSCPPLPNPSGVFYNMKAGYWDEVYYGHITRGYLPKHKLNYCCCTLLEVLDAELVVCCS